jgi:hypothetical protein
MAYTKTNWVPRQGTNLNKFTKSSETSTSVILANTPDAVTQAGTPFSVELMNKIEQGIEDAHAMIAALQAADSFGYLISFPFDPPAFVLAALKALPLAGQIILISDYQRLCDAAYVGDAANATADWWYKTSNPQGTIRDVNGSYMRVLDHQGVFPRAAGQSSKYKMENNTSYNGGAIGKFQGDDNKRHGHKISRYVGNFQSGNYVNMNGGYVAEAIDSDYDLGNVFFGHSGEKESKPASISSYFCIKY